MIVKEILYSRIYYISNLRIILLLLAMLNGSYFVCDSDFSDWLQFRILDNVVLHQEFTFFSNEVEIIITLTGACLVA